MPEDKILSRLQRLERAVAKLARIYHMGWDGFRNNTDLHDIADRNLQVAVECCVDIANHLISARGLRFPETYADAFAVLAEAGLLPGDLAERLSKAAGLRNIIVHEYLSIDRRLLFDSLGDLQDFRRFAERILELVDGGTS